MARVIIYEFRASSYGVWVKCPGCGIFGGLDHEIAKNGDVSPSLDCPSCDFHKNVTLSDWQHGRLERGKGPKGLQT